MVPANSSGGGFHQDGTGSYDFKMLGNANGLAGEGGPTPLVQLRIGFVLTVTLMHLLPQKTSARS